MPAGRKKAASRKSANRDSENPLDNGNTPGVARPRRKQSERTAETRGRLIEATIGCLVEVGYRGTTTVAVCRRAGVSHGSLLHHYGTRERLLGAALDSIYDQLRSPVIASLEALPPGDERVGALVGLMWSAFETPAFKAVIELWLAAKNEPDVGWVVWPEAQAFDAAIGPLAEQLFPEISARMPDFSLYISLIFQTLQGMGLARAAWPDNDDDPVRERVRELLARLVRDAFKEASE